MQLSMLSGAQVEAVKVDFAACFERFWKAYPRSPNMSKKLAKAAYDKALRRATPDEIFMGLTGYDKWLNEPKQKDHPVCHAATWLNQDRWEGFLDCAAVDNPTLQTVSRGTPEHSAWLAYYQSQGRHKNGNAQYLDKLTVPAPMPPQKEAAE